MPDLRIVTPCLNPGGRLARALGSIEGQDVDPRRLVHVIVDGGSTDGTPEVAGAYAERQRARGVRVVVISERDRGQSEAINKGFATGRSEGEVGGWLNADDWYESGALRAVLEAFESEPGADVVVGRCRFIDDSGRCVWSPVPPDPVTAGALLRLRSMWFAGRSIAQPECFFRVEAFRGVGGCEVENHHTMDHELWVKMALAGARFECIDRPLACMGVHAGQKTGDKFAVAASMVRWSRKQVGRVEEDEARLAAEREIEGVARKVEMARALAAFWDREPERGGMRALPPAAVGAVAGLLKGRRPRRTGARWSGLGGVEDAGLAIVDAETTWEGLEEALAGAEAIVLADEPLERERVSGVLAAVRGRVGERLTMNDDVVLGASADVVIEGLARLGGRAVALYPPAFRERLWAAGWREERSVEEHGEGWHPLVPWGWEDGPGLPKEPQFWRVSVWVR